MQLPASVRPHPEIAADPHVLQVLRQVRISQGVTPCAVGLPGSCLLTTRFRGGTSERRLRRIEALNVIDICRNGPDSWRSC
jgi:hypothetical protein